MQEYFDIIHEYGKTLTSNLEHLTIIDEHGYGGYTLLHLMVLHSTEGILFISV